MVEKVDLQDKDFSAFQSPHEASVDRLIKAVDLAYHNPGKMLWRSFWQGFMNAIGLCVGYAAVVFISIYILKLNGGVDLFKPSLDKIKEMIVGTTNDAVNEAIVTNPALQNIKPENFTLPTPSISPYNIP